jgi:hypothetical protein
MELSLLVVPMVKLVSRSESTRVKFSKLPKNKFKVKRIPIIYNPIIIN